MKHPQSNRFLAVSSAVALAAISSSAFAADVLKADNTDSLNLGTSWNLGTAPGTGDVAVWDSTVNGANTVNLGANLSWGGLRIADPGGDVIIGGGNTLTLGASGLDTGSSRNLTLNNTGTITLNGALAGSTVLTINSNATKNWSNSATGMTAVNFTGTLALRGGTGTSGNFSNNWLAFGAASLTQTGSFHLDTGASLTNRGELIITDGWGDGTTKPKLALASLTGFGDFRSDWGGTGNRTISVNSANNHEFQGRIVQNNNSTRSIHFEKLGVGTQILSGENAYQNTIVGAGKLQIGNGGATGNIGLGTVSVASGATLEFNRSGLLDYKASARMRNVSGAGDIVVDGGVKLWNYTGSGTGFDDANSWNNFSGDLIIKGGSEFQTIRNGRTAMGTALVFLGDATTSGTLSQIEGNWTWTNNIQLVGTANQIVNNSTGSDRWNKLQGVLSGDGNVTFSDSTGAMNNGNLGYILTGTNTLTGTLTVDTFVRVGGVTGDSVATTAGTGGTLGAADVVINSGKRLTFSRSDSHTVASTISGAGDLHVGATGISGTGTQVVTLSNTNTYTGATLVSAGTLLVTGSLGDTTVTVQNGATIGGNGDLGGSLVFQSGAQLDLTGATLDLTSIGILSVASGKTMTFDNFGFASIIGWDWINAAEGTYTLIDGGGTDTLSGTTPTVSNPFSFGNGKSGYFQQGSFQAVIIPEPSSALLGGLGMLLLLRRRR